MLLVKPYQKVQHTFIHHWLIFRTIYLTKKIYCTYFRQKKSTLTFNIILKYSF